MGSILTVGKTTIPLKTDTDEVSDGYHTFGELYQFRLLYNAALFNEWAIGDAHYEKHQDKDKYHLFNVYKSWRHADGKPCFDKENYFIVVATLPTGQISNHYKGEYWDMFKIPERDKAEKWDGHTPQDAMQRLTDFLLDSKVSKVEKAVTDEEK